MDVSVGSDVRFAYVPVLLGSVFKATANPFFPVNTLQIMRGAAQGVGGELFFAKARLREVEDEIEAQKRR